MRRLPIAATAVTLALLAPGQGRAGGFYIYEHSAIATGMADARTALWDDPSSLFYNPAAITELDGFQLALGDTLIFPEITYTPACPTGETCHGVTSGGHVFYPAHAYFTAEIVPWLHAGLSWNNPFGLGTYWPADWDGRFTAYETYIETHFIQPVLALDIAGLAGLPPEVRLSFAAGGEYVYAKAEIAQKLDASGIAGSATATPEPVAEMSLDGSAHGGGYNFSLFAAYLPWISFGASVRSNVVLDFEGNAAFTAPADALVPGAWGDTMRSLLGLLPASTTGSTSIELPWNMNFGVAFHGLPNFTFAADVYVALWESYDELAVQFNCEDEAPGTANWCSSLLNESARYPKNWHTGIQAAFGVEYRPIRDLAIRVGYGYVTDPTDPEHYDGMLPDGNRHLISAGIGYRAPWLFKVDVGYMLALWGNTKNNDVGEPTSLGTHFDNTRANGDYDTVTHLVALSLGFSFDMDGMAEPPTLDSTTH